MAPPITRPMPTADSIEPLRRSEMSSATMTTRATTPMNGPTPRPWLKAMPLLNVRLKRSEPTTSTTWPSLSELTAHRLESWSARTTRAADRDAHRGERAGRPGLAHRRVPSPPTFSSTSSVAHGIAFRRSFGMGRPEMTECPYVPSLMRASAASMSLMV